MSLKHKVATPNSNAMWFLISKVPTYDENGVVSGLVGVNHDITLLKQAEQKVIELELERERSNILASFITDSSHEFRTPISVIQTSAYLLEKVDDPNKRRHYATRITRQIDRLTNLLDSLQLMSHLDRKTYIQVKSIDLQGFLKDVMDQCQSQLLDKSQTIHLIDDNPQISIRCNEELLATAVSAILDNAIHNTPDNGDIIVRSYAQDDTTILSIQDTGIGMTDETLPRIFERFYRADQAHSTSGFGLGLSIAKRIIELHGGTVEVDSQLDVGSTFLIILPQTIPDTQ
jgi:signal transduction histidine kinase